MNMIKRMLLSISLIFSVAECAGVGPNTRYYIDTTSFHYDPSYSPYMLKLNRSEIGDGE